MRRDRLCFSRALKHEQLGQNSHRLQPNGKWPQNFRKGELVVEEEGKDEAGSEDIFNLEGVDGRVMRWSETRTGDGQNGLEKVEYLARGWPVFDLHEVENIATAADEKQFHDRVVYRYVVEKKVKISCKEDTNVEGLCFKGYTYTKEPSKSIKALEQHCEWQEMTTYLDMTVLFGFYATELRWTPNATGHLAECGKCQFVLLVV